MSISRVISGGQTGADRGGLDAAMVTETLHGGWCPAGRKAEDGTIPGKYNLQTTATDQYDQRTRANVEEAEATLVFTYGEPTGGSELTLRLCREFDKPRLHVDLRHMAGPDAVRLVKQWLAGTVQLDLLAENAPIPPDPCVLNVAGQRESEAPGIGAAVKRIMIHILTGDASPDPQRRVQERPADPTHLGFD